MLGKRILIRGLSCISLMLLMLMAGTGAAQNSVGSSGKPSAQEIPDAPSAVRPPQPVAPTTPAPSSTQFPAPTDTSNQPPTTSVPRASDRDSDIPPPPPFDVKTVPAGSAPPGSTPAQEELFKISVNTNFVEVPVTVKDRDGHLVGGLLPKDFTILEDNVPQKISFFTSDPFAMSVAVVIDLSMPDIAVNRIHETFSALQGAFAPYDEVALYTYSSAVRRTADFSAPESLDAILREMKHTEHGVVGGGVAVTSGPLASGPQVNGRPLDGTGPLINRIPQETHALNDAILAAALDLGHRERSRRRVIFVISDGREDGSKASFRDTLKVLLSREIAVYAVAVDAAALPGYGRLQRIKLPKYGYGNILPKYVSATAGQLFTELSREAIETSYSRLTSEARNQYTIGYLTKSTTSGAKREIEVRVKRPEVQVYAKEGYYPAPTAR